MLRTNPVEHAGILAAGRAGVPGNNTVISSYGCVCVIGKQGSATVVGKVSGQGSAYEGRLVRQGGGANRKS